MSPISWYLYGGVLKIQEEDHRPLHGPGYIGSVNYTLTSWPRNTSDFVSDLAKSSDALQKQNKTLKNKSKSV